MTLHLADTTAYQIARGITSERHRLGGPAPGKVLTLVIITDEQNQSEATRAAEYSSNQHPCRILVVIPRPGRGQPRLDAEIQIGDQEGPGETVTMRMFGPLAEHGASVVLPLLVADTPVVAWWPGFAPDRPADDPVGRLAQRRITDAGAARHPSAALAERAAGYSPGDTDLAWTRTTPWRSTLAIALDEPYGEIASAKVSCQRSNPSGHLLAAWLGARLGVPVALAASRGPGVTGVALETDKGTINLTRSDGRMAKLSRPYTRTRLLPLPRRELPELVAEELRRLDSDQVYQEALAEFTRQQEANK